MKPDCILIRYGEIALKARQTRYRFEQRLMANIRYAFSQKGRACSLKNGWGRIYVKTENISDGMLILQKIFGITSMSPVYQTDSSLSSITKLAQDVFHQSISDEKTFALRVRRTGSHEFSSQDVAVKVGAHIDKQTALSVDLSNPDFELFIEVRDDHAFVFIEKIPGPGGMPFGTQGKILAYIDTSQALLASWFLLKRGVSVVFLVETEELKEITKSFMKNWYIKASIVMHDVSQEITESINEICTNHRCAAVCVGSTLSQEKDYELMHLNQLSTNTIVPVLHPLIIFNENRLKELVEKVGLNQ